MKAERALTGLSAGLRGLRCGQRGLRRAPKSRTGWSTPVPLGASGGGVRRHPLRAEGGQGRDGRGFTTDGDGTFSVTFRPWDGGYCQLALDTTEDPFLQPSTGLSDLVHVHHGAVFTDSSALRTDERTVHAEGHMDFPDGFTPMHGPAHRAALIRRPGLVGTDDRRGAIGRTRLLLLRGPRGERRSPVPGRLRRR